jgi:hypothetical protein
MRIRYRRGEVGETQRVVHFALETPAGLLRSLCGLEFQPHRIEHLGYDGMPCMQCTLAAALSSCAQSPQFNEHSALPNG